MKDGFYPDLDFDTYKSLPRVNATMLKWSRVSPYDCWARSWMGDVEPPDTKFTSLGRIYHTMLVEGREEFDKRYYTPFEGDPSLPRTVDELKAALREANLKVSGTKAALNQRLVDIGVVTHDDAKREHDNKHLGKDAVEPEHVAWATKAHAVIQHHEQFQHLFAGGAPECTILWTDQESGLPMKARPDYLQDGCVVDLKTFSNPLRKPIERAVVTSFASQAYHVQAACYMAAVNAACEAGWISDKIDREFVFLFMQTGPVPVPVARILANDSSIMSTGRIVMRDAISEIKQNLDTYGEDPWVPAASQIEYFDDTMFPAWITEY